MNRYRLDRDCMYYCGELRNKHKKQRRYLSHDGKRKWIWDLPKCAVSCCTDKNVLYHDYSKPVRKDTYDKVPKLKEELLKCAPHPMGKIGDVTILPNCGNQVGRCAEPHAAKECMLGDKIESPVAIRFSISRDITTGEPMVPCAICKFVFPDLK